MRKEQRKVQKNKLRALDRKVDITNCLTRWLNKILRIVVGTRLRKMLKELSKQPQLLPSLLMNPKNNLLKQ